MTRLLFSTVALLHAATAAATNGCADVLDFCGGQSLDGSTCCANGAACLTPASARNAGGYGDADIEAGGYGFYGADPETQPYSICAPEPPASGIAGVNLLTLTLADTIAGLDSGRFSSEALTRAFLAQIARYEDTYNAFTFLNPGALAQARASDARRATTGALSDMDGVPIVIKEALDVAGFPSTLGWNYTYSGAGGVDLYPLQNAALVQRLLDAGVVALGKTNIPPFSAANTRPITRGGVASWDGLTFNAVNADLVPGASSTGTATAVAAGMAVWGIGEETGGSIQNPSAAQSLVGVKTTQGLVPTGGAAPRSSGATRDVLGPITKTVRDAAIALNAMTGYGTSSEEPGVPTGGYESLFGNVTLSGARLGLYGPGFREVGALSPDADQAYSDALDELRGLGAVTVPDPFAGSGFAALRAPKTGYNPQGVEAFPYAFAQFLKRGFGFDTYAAFVDYVGVDPLAAGEVLGGELATFPPGAEQDVLAAGLANPDAPTDLGPFEAYKASWLSIFDSVFADNDLDALVFPQAQELLPEYFGPYNINATTVGEINVLGVPAVIVPSTRVTTSDGQPSPFALIIIGPAFSEAKLLALAYDYEQATQLRWVPELQSSIDVPDMAALV